MTPAARSALWVCAFIIGLFGREIRGLWDCWWGVRCSRCRIRRAVPIRIELGQSAVVEYGKRPLCQKCWEKTWQQTEEGWR